MQRREFLRCGGFLLGGAMLGLTAAGAAPGRPARGAMQYRPLGRTGHLRSVVTLGGIVVMNEDQAAADRLVAEALDAGVNAVDTAPSYGDAELKLGHALRGRREQVFLGCKTTRRDRAGAAEELRRSLQRMETDYFDLYQFHGLDKPEDLEQVLGPGGAMEAFLEAREQGLIRFLGMTGHRPDTFLRALDEIELDAVMYPVNFVLHHHGYGLKLLKRAVELGVGIQAIKPIAGRRWAEGEPRLYPKCWYRPFGTNRDLALAMRYVLSLPVATAVPSGDMRLFRRALSAALHYRPPDERDRARMAEIAADLEPLFCED